MWKPVPSVSLFPRSFFLFKSCLPLIPLRQVKYGAYIVMGAFFWNGLYFLDRVVANHAVRELELELEAKGLAPADAKAKSNGTTNGHQPNRTLKAE